MEERRVGFVVFFFLGLKRRRGKGNLSLGQILRLFLLGVVLKKERRKRGSTSLQYALGEGEKKKEKTG